MAQPLPDSSQLIDDINHAKETASLNEFAIARFRRRAAALRSVDRSDSFVIEGILDSIEKKYDNVQASFRKAFDANASSWFAHINYSITLREWGKYHLAYDHASKATKFATSTEELHETVKEVRLAAHQGLKIKCLAAIDDDERLRAIVSFMDRNGISDDDLATFADVLYSTLDVGSCAPPSLSLLKGESETLYIQAEIAVGPEEAATLSFKLADNLAEYEIPAYINRAVTIGISTCQ